jgi:hypothetical protein
VIQGTCGVIEGTYSVLQGMFRKKSGKTFNSLVHAAELLGPADIVQELQGTFDVI